MITINYNYCKLQKENLISFDGPNSLGRNNKYMQF